MLDETMGLADAADARVSRRHGGRDRGGRRRVGRGRRGGRLDEALAVASSADGGRYPPGTFPQLVPVHVTGTRGRYTWLQPVPVHVAATCPGTRGCNLSRSTRLQPVPAPASDARRGVLRRADACEDLSLSGETLRWAGRVVTDGPIVGVRLIDPWVRAVDAGDLSALDAPPAYLPPGPWDALAAPRWVSPTSEVPVHVAATCPGTRGCNLSRLQPVPARRRLTRGRPRAPPARRGGGVSPRRRPGTA